MVAVFFPELKGNPLFLFLGGMVVNTFVEYVTGRIMEMSLHKKLVGLFRPEIQSGRICMPENLGYSGEFVPFL